MPSSLPAPVLEFLDRFSQMMAGEGLPRPAGRMLGLFFVEGGEQSAADLSRKLRISRSNVSTTVRLLESYGLLERTRPPGERQDRFQLPADPFVPLLHAGAARAARMRDLVRDCREGLPATLAPAGTRLGELQSFFGHAAGWLGRMRDDWSTENTASPTKR